MPGKRNVAHATRGRGGNASAKEGVQRLRRWLVFNAVGTMGVAVQLLVLVALTGMLGFDYRVATVLAVEAAILHNFFWHERWTWGDRGAGAGSGAGGRWARLAWFNLVTGTLSIAANVVFTALYAETFGVHYVLANLMAIASCSLLTFIANDRFVFRRSAATGAAPAGTEPAAAGPARAVAEPAPVAAGAAPAETGVAPWSSGACAGSRW